LPERRAIFATAGSGKTTELVDRALAANGGRVLLVTFTSENQRRLEARLRERVGIVPENVRVMGWFSFLINECIKPYQRVLTEAPFAVRGLNFKGDAPRYAKNTEITRYLDGNSDLYRDRVAQCAVYLNSLTGGKVARRLQDCYRHVFVDEVQDCAGHDLEVLDMLFATSISIVIVGDPRQAIITTNNGNLNKKYRGLGLWTWVKERSKLVTLDERTVNHRCHADICALADSIFPTLLASSSSLTRVTGHDGVYFVSAKDLQWYLALFPQDAVLRQTKATDSCGLTATNIGVAKGATFDRVLILPTSPMRAFLKSRDPRPLRSPEHLYVGVTRARFSVTFVVPENDCSAYTRSAPGSHVARDAV
jgi:DNA helicase II / ATP-dependent DNA helicase PcrA